MIQNPPRYFQSPLSGQDTNPEVQLLKKKLADSKRQFASVLSCLSGLFYRCELHSPWRMSFVSEGVHPLTGYTERELERRNGWSDIVHPDDHGRIETEVAKAISADESFHLIYRVVHKSGEVRWVSERGYAVPDNQGNPCFLEGVITDVTGQKAAENLQDAMLEKWKRTLDTIPQMVWTMAADGSDEFYNARWFEFTGCQSGAEVPNRIELVHEEDRARAATLWQEKFESGEPYEAQYRLRHASGEYRWILSRGECEKSASGAPIRWYGTCTDIHDQVLARVALRESEAVNRSMIEASPDSISFLDIDGTIKFLNPAAKQALGLSNPDSLLGKPWAHAFPFSSRGAASLAIAQAANGRKARLTAEQSASDGQRWWDVVIAPIDDGETGPRGLISVAREITHQKSAEERVRWAADHDALTRLPNRALFQRTLERALGCAKARSAPLTLLMMDLDDFKQTNDALGHLAGDALLQEFADRLQGSVRSDDMVARLGGDEFAVLLRGVSSNESISKIVRTIINHLKSPFEYEGRLLDLSTSIGASSFPTHAAAATELIKYADTALYVAKKSGKSALRIFRPDMHADAQARVTMLELARQSLRDDGIVANYQPKVDLRTGKIAGFEALLRWQHSTKGLQRPETISAAFDDGLLAAQISDRMINCVISDMQRWADAGVEVGHIALNAGAAEFKRGSYADKLLEAVAKAGLSPSSIQLEVTETVFLGRGAEFVESALRTLSEAGVSIALDDFGTGYASLSHLNNFPVDVIKIDRSFIANLDTSARDAAIVRAVIKLGQSLGIKIVAEGIETHSQARFLKKHRCPYGQGFLYGKACDAAAIPALLVNGAATE